MMDKYFTIAVPLVKDPIQCIYKTLEENGPRFLYVNLSKIESAVHCLKTDESAMLTIKGIKKGKAGRNIDIRTNANPHIVTRYRNLTIEQANDLYLAVCVLGMVTEVTGETRGVATWTILGSPIQINNKSLDIPVFLRK